LGVGGRHVDEIGKVDRVCSVDDQEVVERDRKAKALEN
jgi:hypothetical protein